jgi:predicted metal-dependent hydrolase
MADTGASEVIPDSFWDGIQQFNQGDFYRCHDTLEAIWMVAAPPDKPFYQGILQIAVGFYHLGNHNWRGAAILLGEGSRRLEPYEPSYHQLDVTTFLDETALWLETLQQLGPDQVAAIATQLTSAEVPVTLPALASLSVPKISKA